MGVSHKKVNGTKSLRANLFLVIAFCTILYTPILKNTPFISNLFAYGAPILLILFNIKTAKNLIRGHIKTVVFSFFLLVLSYLVILINMTGDFSYIAVTTYFFRKALAYFSLLCLIAKKYGKEKSLEYFLYYFILTHVIYVITTILMVFIPQFQEFWFSIFSKGTDLENLFKIRGYTFRIGWQGFAGFRLTLYCTFGAIFSLFLRYGTKNCRLGIAQFLVFFLGCILGNMFYGRIGLLATIIVSTIAIVYWNRKKIKNILLSIVAILIFILSIGALKDLPLFHDWYEWVSTPIINLVQTGDFNDESFDKLQAMTDITISEPTMIFGDGYYMVDGRYYMETDAGYLRSILFWGLFGTLLAYALTFYTILGIKDISMIMVIQLLITFIMFEYKGAVYYEFIPLAFIISVAANKLPHKKQKEIINYEE